MSKQSVSWGQLKFPKNGRNYKKAKRKYTIGIVALYIELTIFQGSVNSKTEIMFPAEIVTAVTMLHLQHRDNVVLRDNLISLHYIQYTAEY